MRTLLTRLCLTSLLIPFTAFAASPFDVFNRVKDAVNEVKDAPKKLMEPSSSGVTASDEAAAELAVQALMTDSMTPEQEALIGREVAGSLLGTANLVDDQRLQDYVNKVGTWLAQQSTRPELAWQFGVINTSDINAFAAPGGYVLISLGLFQLLENEAELATVLAHEITHVEKRHHLNLLKQSSMLGALSEVVGSRIADRPAAIQNLVGSGAELMARGLDKGAELASDRGALVLAARAGYDPYAYFMVLQKIAKVADNDDSQVSLLFKTHPQPEERLTALALAAGDDLERYPGDVVAQRFYRPAASTAQ